MHISDLNRLTIDYPCATNDDISTREALTEADLIWLSLPHKHTHTYVHMHGGKQPTFVICITLIQLKWLADGMLWAALKCVTAWQRLRCAWISRCAWIVATLIMGGVWRSCHELCHAKDMTNVLIWARRFVYVCLENRTPEVCQAKLAVCHQIEKQN